MSNVMTNALLKTKETPANAKKRLARKETIIYFKTHFRTNAMRLRRGWGLSKALSQTAMSRICIALNYAGRE
jgi:hypothetical protein